MISRDSDPDSIKSDSDDASMRDLPNESDKESDGESDDESMSSLVNSSQFSDNSESSEDRREIEGQEAGQWVYNEDARMKDYVIEDSDDPRDSDDSGSDNRDYADDDSSEADYESSNDGEIDLPGDPLQLIIQPGPERLTSAQVQNQGEDKAEEGTPTLPAGVKSFAELQKDSFPSNSFELAQSYEEGRWHMLGLEEMKQELEEKLEEARKKQEDLKSEITGCRDRFCQMVNDGGISMKLWDAYQDFCESMEPEFGSTRGWSITCESDHRGSYVEYDPTFALLKEHSELPWSEHNFRCEPTIDPTKSTYDSPAREVVEFWPVENIVSGIEIASTWGDLYPVLYDQATEAARNGSEAAMGMLIALPDQHASFKGGWLFEYFPTNELAPTRWTATDTGYYRYTSVEVLGDGYTPINPPHSRRWTYRSAHNIAAPEDPATKRQRIMQSLKTTTVAVQPAKV
ncbi:hypothetical protein F5Y03DRAFT_365684 [Xylaria venustula]|nr:hypothetical protein F5Y03DRAFT_365684 [Xylaria venustula]